MKLGSKNLQVYKQLQNIPFFASSNCFKVESYIGAGTGLDREITFSARLSMFIILMGLVIFEIIFPMILKFIFNNNHNSKIVKFINLKI